MQIDTQKMLIKISPKKKYNWNHQYSEREALPEKVAYWAYTLLIDSENVIVQTLLCLQKY